MEETNASFLFANISFQKTNPVSISSSYDILQFVVSSPLQKSFLAVPQVTALLNALPTALKFICNPF
ncbi:MAG: hypothetical protein V8S22_09760 [Lachnospiraceae bacterium]